MKLKIHFWAVGILLLTLMAHSSPAISAGQTDPLAAWRPGPAKQAIVDFVAKVTQKGGPDYVPPAKRIAVFDNDGTLWAEKPFYFQMAFVLNQVKKLAAKHPQWKGQEPFASALSDDPARLAKLSHQDFFKLVAATHAGMTSQQFQAQARAWLAHARHSQKGRLYTQMVYEPMLELLNYLSAHGFINFIVSGGGVDFLRAFAEEVYGIPPQRVIGSSLKSRWQMAGGKPSIIKLPQIGSINDKEGKPLNIDLHIGRRPILAAGNSDGDLAMLQWTGAGKGPRLMLLVHHDDAKREYAYDRHSGVGRLDKALDLAREQGWTVVSMADDFKMVFSAAKE